MKFVRDIRRGRTGSRCLAGHRVPISQMLESRVLLAATAYTGTPYPSAPATLPGTVLADNFDHGGNNITYYQTAPGNQGGAYRNTGVSIEVATDAVPPGLTASSPGVGFDVCHIVATDWMNYSVNVTASGNYTFTARVANAGAAGTYHFEVDGTNVTGSMNLPVTGGWQTYTNVTSQTVALTSGPHVIRLAFDTSGAHEMGNVYWFQVAPVASPTVSGTLNWNAITPSPEPRSEGSAAVVGGKYYVFGGFDADSFTSDTEADVYDPATNTWTRLADMPEPLTHCQTVVEGSTIWLIGGFIGPEVDGGSADVWKYDTVANTYTAGPSLPSALGAAGVVLLGRNIHVISGLSASNGVFYNTTEHWVLNLDNEAAGWTNAAPMPRPRNHAGTVVFNNQIWVVGGQDAKNEFTGNSSAVDVYDPTTNTWTEPGDLPEGRSHLLNSMVVYNGVLYAFGGETNGPGGNSLILGDAIAWNPATSSWLEVPGYALPSPRKAPNVAVIGSTLIAFGGADPGPLAGGWSAQLPSIPETPYLGAPFQVGQTIMADNYNNGGEGVGYHNVLGINYTQRYRTDGVAIEPSGDVAGPGLTTASPGEPYDVGFLVAGDWQDYTINIPTTGTYSFDARVSSALQGGTFHLESDGVNVTGSMTFPSTGGWQTYTTVTKTGIQLTAGVHTLRLVLDSAINGTTVGNENWIRIYTPGAIAVPAASIAAPTDPTSTSTPAKNAVDLTVFSKHKIKIKPVPHKPAVHLVKHPAVKHSPVKHPPAKHPLVKHPPVKHKTKPGDAHVETSTIHPIQNS